MATISGVTFSHHGNLTVLDSTDRIEFNNPYAQVFRITNRSNTATLWVRLDGPDAEAGVDGNILILPLQNISHQNNSNLNPLSLSITSNGVAASYEVVNVSYPMTDPIPFVPPEE